MIPPLIDPAPRPDEALQLALARHPAGDAPPRFAELLKETPLARVPQKLPTLDPEGEGARDARARLFNQDGLFGLAQPAPMSPPIAPAIAAEQPSDPGAPPSAVATFGLTSGVAAGPTAPAVGRNVAIPLPFQIASTSPSVATHDVRLPVATPSSPPKSELRSDVPMPSNRPGRPPPQTRRPMPQPNATLAVAVHAATRGLEIVAQIRGLGERERAALADEIAALLSAHGYAPAQISVIIAAPRATRQEHR